MSLTLTRRHNVDRFGYLIPTRYGNVPMVGAVATYRPGEGRFGGAVAVEEATQNLIALNKNNYAMSGLLNFKLLTPTGFEADLNASTDVWHYVRWDLSLPVGTYTIHFEIEPQLSQGRFRLCVGKATEGDYPQTYVPSRDLIDASSINRQRKQFTFQVTDGSAATRIVFFKANFAGGHVKVEKLQLENKPFATSFVDGTRGAGRLTYPLVGSSEFTVAVWFKGLGIAENKPIPDWRAILQLAEGERSGSRWWFEVDNDGSGNPRFRTVAGVLAPYDNEWHHFVVVRRSDGVHQVYFDGEYKHQNTPGWTPSFLRLGHKTNGDDHLNCLFDELLILPYAASEEEIRSWYEADGPMPTHPAALLQWDWQAVRPATMVAL